MSAKNAMFIVIIGLCIKIGKNFLNYNLNFNIYIFFNIWPMK